MVGSSMFDQGTCDKPVEISIYLAWRIRVGVGVYRARMRWRSTVYSIYMQSYKIVEPF